MNDLDVGEMWAYIIKIMFPQDNVQCNCRTWQDLLQGCCIGLHYIHAFFVLDLAWLAIDTLSALLYVSLPQFYKSLDLIL